METRPELIEISILCYDGSKEHFLNNSDFNKWIRSHRLADVKAFPYLHYKVNNEDKRLKIDRILNKWNVVNFNDEDKIKIEFSFECNEGKNFTTVLYKTYFSYLYPFSGNDEDVKTGI